MLRKNCCIATIAILGAVVSAATAIEAQTWAVREFTEIRRIIADFEAYIGKEVAVQGEVTSIRTAGPTLDAYYALKDASGTVLVQQAAGSLEPSIGAKHTIIGVVGYERGADPPLFVREVHRLPYGSSLVPPTPTVPPSPPPAVEAGGRPLEPSVRSYPSPKPEPTPMAETRPARIVFFTVSPAEVEVGHSATISGEVSGDDVRWSVARVGGTGSGTITLSSGYGPQVVSSFTASAKGSVMLRLTASNEKGSVAQEVEVTVLGSATPSWLWPVIIGAGALLFILVVVLAVMAAQRGGKTAAPAAGDGLALPPPTVVEGSTIKFHAPPPGTLKVLPGRFEVVGDPSVKEIRVFKTKDDVETDVTLGRAAGPPYSHIQLKPQTVSAKQCKLMYSNGTYTIINYSSTNPTRVNGEALGTGDSRRLNDGDKIEMGEVTLIYHER